MEQSSMNGHNKLLKVDKITGQSTSDEVALYCAYVLGNKGKFTHSHYLLAHNYVKLLERAANDEDC